MVIGKSILKPATSSCQDDIVYTPTSVWNAIFRRGLQGQFPFFVHFFTGKAEKCTSGILETLIIYLVREWEMWGVWELKTPVGVRRGEVRCIFGAFFSFIRATNFYHILSSRIFLYFLQVVLSLGFLVIGVGIGFALLAHPCLGLLCKKSATTWRCLC